MRAFIRPGFRLDGLGLEAKVIYTTFLVLAMPGVASMAALSFFRIGATPSAVARYYRGSDDEMQFPKNFWQMMEVSHAHLFIIPVVALILTHLLLGTSIATRYRTALIGACFIGTVLEAVGPWLTRYASAHFSWLLLIGWALLLFGFVGCIAVSLVQLWRRTTMSDETT